MPETRQRQHLSASGNGSVPYSPEPRSSNETLGVRGRPEISEDVEEYDQRPKKRCQRAPEAAESQEAVSLPPGIFPDCYLTVWPGVSTQGVGWQSPTRGEPPLPSQEEPVSYHHLYPRSVVGGIVVPATPLASNTRLDGTTATAQLQYTSAYTHGQDPVQTYEGSTSYVTGPYYHHQPLAPWTPTSGEPAFKSEPTNRSSNLVPPAEVFDDGFLSEAPPVRSSESLPPIAGLLSEIFPLSFDWRGLVYSRTTDLGHYHYSNRSAPQPSHIQAEGCYGYYDQFSPSARDAGLDQQLPIATPVPEESPARKTVPVRKARAKLSKQARRENRERRSMGACIRCHHQRAECLPNSEDPDNPNAACERCMTIYKGSAKFTHNNPCLRGHVTAITVYRLGGLGYTKRFSQFRIVNIDDFADNEIHTVYMAQGLSRAPLVLKVRRFNPIEGDMVHRKYLDAEGRTIEYAMEPYCLADAHETAEQFSMYILKYAVAGLTEASRGSHEIIQKVFAKIREKFNAEIPRPGKGEDEIAWKHQDLLRRTVLMWFIIRHGSGSAWLCGDNPLGMKPVEERNCSVSGRVPIPPMIVAQFDSIRYQRIYKDIAPGVLCEIQKTIKFKNDKGWFTIFLITFLLLHNTAFTCQDRRRWAKQHKGGVQLETRYGDLAHPLCRFVAEMQKGAVTLLAHWQYFKRANLMVTDWDNIKKKSILSALKPDEVEFMKEITSLMNQKLPTIPQSPEDGCWEHELFWISRMFFEPRDPRNGEWMPPNYFREGEF